MPTINIGIDLGAIEMKPITLAGPIDTANTFTNPINAEAIPAPIIPKINGNLNFKFTPKIAGSVIPNIAEILADEARPFCFLSPVTKKIARHAAPCATFAIERSEEHTSELQSRGQHV